MPYFPVATRASARSTSSRRASACARRADVRSRSNAIVAPSGSCSSSLLASSEAATMPSSSAPKARRRLNVCSRSASRSVLAHASFTASQYLHRQSRRFGLVPSLDRLLAFMATAFVVIVVPGPSVLFVVSRALASGRRVAVWSVVGNALGEYVQVVAVAFGIGALAERSVAAFTTIKLVGGAYLVYLGAKTFRQRRSLGKALATSPEQTSDRRSFAQGVTVGVTNPKTVVFLSAILPQFVDRAGGHVPDQILLLGLAFAVIAIASDTMWALAAGRARTWFACSPRRLELIGGAGGLAIVAIGAGLLVSGRRD